MRNERNNTLQAAIPGSLQSLGATERRRCYFKDITLQIKDKTENKQIRPVDWQVYDASSTLHLIKFTSARVRSVYARKRVVARTPKMPTGAVGNPMCCDLKNQADSPSTQTNRSIVEPMGVRKHL